MKLTPTEGRIFKLLSQGPKTRRELYAGTWKKKFNERRVKGDKNLNVHLMNIRAKLANTRLAIVFEKEINRYRLVTVEELQAEAAQ